MSWSHQLTRRQTIKALGGFGAAGTLTAGNSSAHATDAAAATANAKWLTLPLTPTLPVTTRKGVATVNGTMLRCAVRSGTSGSSAAWRIGQFELLGRQIEHLASSFTIVVMDTRGHGRSAVTSHSFGYHLFAEDAAGLLDFLKIPQASIVGWSDGAVTGLQLAMTKPDRVSKLFAFGANSSADGLKANGARSPVFARFGAAAGPNIPSSPHIRNDGRNCSTASAPCGGPSRISASAIWPR